MAESDGQEKSEQATGKRLEDTRHEGKVVKSIELNSFAIFTTGLLMVFLTQKYISSRIGDYASTLLNSLEIVNVNRDFLQNFAKEFLVFLLLTLAPVLGVLFVVSLVVNIAQFGFRLTFKPLSPNFSRFNPITGIKKVMISSRSLIEVLKSLLKLFIIGMFAYSVLSNIIFNVWTVTGLAIPEVIKYLIDAAYSLLWRIVLVYALFAAIDFIYQRYSFNKELKMTKQEVKDENKQQEGDPLIKGRIKRLQFQAAKSRMMKNVPKADVVITNPTHYAVALKYDMLKDTAPRVLAKGVDELALRIKAVAIENGIHIHEDKELARALFKYCDIGDLIPAKLFKTVAQILAYIYKLKNANKKKSIV